MTTSERGFTVVELIVVMLMLAVVASIALPRAVKSSPQLQVDLAARALTRDLEQLRMRAISAKRQVRIAFDESEGFYTAFMDLTPDRSGAISANSDEVHESGLLTKGRSGGLPVVPLQKGIRFGTGSASSGPFGAAASDAIQLENDWAQFDPRGMVMPAGQGGVVFLTHEDDPEAVAAVTISGASAFHAWRYREGTWSK